MQSARQGWQELLERGLADATGSKISLLAEASRHITQAGGKRVRPSLVYLSYLAAGGTHLADVTPVAAAAELIHTASLVHDDLNDQSHLRRGVPSVNAVWGGTAALLTGDFLFVKAVSLIAPLGPQIVGLFAEACVRLVEGETMQLQKLGDLAMSEELYIEIVKRKTAALFSACAESGAVLGGAAPKQAQAFRKYGQNLGIAFQIRDDCLDLLGDEGELGKPTDEDVQQGKMSLMLMQMLKDSPQAEELVGSREVARLREMMRASGASEYAGSVACSFARRAQEALEPLAPSDAKSALEELADFCIVRTH